MSRFNAQKDYYKILRVREDATPEEIGRSYRQQAGQHHPDRGGDEEMMKSLNEAYAVLSDAEKRADYDQQRGTINRYQPEPDDQDDDGPRATTPAFDLGKVAERPGGDLFGLMVGAGICLVLGLPFLILIEIQWVFFLWPLRILAAGIVLIGVLLAHAAFRHKHRQLIKRPTLSRGHLLLGEFVFWSIALGSGYLLYVLLHAVSK